MFLMCHVILCHHIIKNRTTLWVGAPQPKITTVLSLIIIGVMKVEM